MENTQVYGTLYYTVVTYGSEQSGVLDWQRDKKMNKINVDDNANDLTNGKVGNVEGFKRVVRKLPSSEGPTLGKTNYVFHFVRWHIV